MPLVKQALLVHFALRGTSRRRVLSHTVEVLLGRLSRAFELRRAGGGCLNLVWRAFQGAPAGSLVNGVVARAALIRLKVEVI